MKVLGVLGGIGPEFDVALPSLHGAGTRAIKHQGIHVHPNCSPRRTYLFGG